MPAPSSSSVRIRHRKVATTKQHKTTENVETDSNPATEVQCRLCGEPCPLNMALGERDFRTKVEDITGESIPVVVQNKATTGYNVCEPCQNTVEDFYQYKAHCWNVLEGRMEKLNVEELLDNCEVEIALSQETLEDIGIGQVESKETNVEKKKRRYQVKTEEEKAMSPAEYQKHYKQVYKMRNQIECEICHQKLEKKYLDGHMNRHYGLEPYACAHCGLQFHCKLNRSRHEVRNHAPEEETIPCDVCGKMIRSRTALKQHMKSHQEKKFECQQCGVKAPNQNTLKRHMDHIHNQVRNFVCPQCGKAFYRQYVLNIHLRTHSGDTPYVCDVCQRRFVHRRIYVDHMRKQHPAEPMMRLDIAKGWKETARNAMGM